MPVDARYQATRRTFVQHKCPLVKIIGKEYPEFLEEFFLLCEAAPPTHTCTRAVASDNPPVALPAGVLRKWGADHHRA